MQDLLNWRSFYTAWYWAILVDTLKGLSTDSQSYLRGSSSACQGGRHV